MTHKLEFNVTKATVLLRTGTDLVYLDTEKPSPFPPRVSNDYLTVQFETQANTGVDYCRKHLGIEPEVIDTRSK